MSGAGGYRRFGGSSLPGFMDRYKKSAGEKYDMEGDQYLLAKRFARVCAYSRILDKIEEENNKQESPNLALNNKVGEARRDIVAFVDILENAKVESSDGKEADELFAKLEAEEGVEGSLKDVCRLAKRDGNFKSFAAEIAGNVVSEKHVTVKKLSSLMHKIASAEFKRFLGKAGSVKYFEPTRFSRILRSLKENGSQSKVQAASGLITHSGKRERRRSVSADSTSVDSAGEDSVTSTVPVDDRVVDSPLPPIMDAEDLFSAAELRNMGPLDGRLLERSSAILPVAAQKVVQWERDDFEYSGPVSQNDIDKRVDAELKELTYSMLSKDVSKHDEFANRYKHNKAFQSHLSKIYKDLISRVDEAVDRNNLGGGNIDRSFMDDVSSEINDWAIEHLGRKMTSDENSVVRDSLSSILKSYAQKRQELGEESAMQKAGRSAKAVGAFIANVVFVVTVVGPIVQAVRGKEAAEIFVPQELMKCYDPLSKSRRDIFDKSSKALLSTIQGVNISKSYPMGRAMREGVEFVKPASRYKKSSQGRST